VEPAEVGFDVHRDVRGNSADWKQNIELKKIKPS
jgi:hypothetical protein